jgi:hypothetical protein
MLTHPDDPLSSAGRVALGLGIALYLFGFALGRLRLVRRIVWERVAGGTAALVVSLALDDLAAIWLLAIAVSILTAVCAVEAVRLRDLRRRIRGAH